MLGLLRHIYMLEAICCRGPPLLTCLSRENLNEQHKYARDQYRRFLLVPLYSEKSKTPDQGCANSDVLNPDPTQKLSLSHSVAQEH